MDLLMSSFFIKIPMTIYSANINGNSHVSGIPSMTSVDGFVHNLERKIKEIDGDFYVNSWAYVIEDVEYREGTKRYSGARNNNAEKGTINTPMEDEKLAHINQIVIVKVTSSLSLPEFKEFRENGVLDSVLMNMNFGGGTTRFRMPKGHVGVFFYEDLEKCLKSVMPSSLLIEDRTHIINERKHENESSLDAMIRILNVKTDEEYLGYLIPVAIGYYQISDLKIRKNTRKSNMKHMYAEPVIGMARARTVASALLNLESEDFNPMWVNAKLSNEQLISEKYYILKGTK